MSIYHLAQINVSRLLAPLDSPLLADFVANLEPINLLAEQSQGFVWRLKDDDGDATAIKIFDDTMIIVNMSVWEDLESLKNFAFNSAHTPIMKRRREWFEKFPTAYMAMWYVEAGHIPTVAEARQKLEFLDEHGPTLHAFTFKQVFTNPSA